MQSNTEIYLAPIQGITNEVYVDCYHELFQGVDHYCAPFIKVQLNRESKRKRKRDLLPIANKHLSYIPQLLSNDSREFFSFDQDLKELGYHEFNWNLGCPYRMVTNKKRGSGLLPYADKIKALLDDITGNLHCELSIKVRLGLLDTNDILELIPLFNHYPIKELIIHPRFGKQMYDGVVDLKRFEECLIISNHPVVYNGDIFNVETYKRLKKQFPQIHKWMLGRGILANPFLPGQIKGFEYDHETKLEKLKRFHQCYAEGYEKILSGPTHLMDKLKEFWSFLQFSFEDGSVFFHKLKKTKHQDAYDSMVQSFFASNPKVMEHVHAKSMDFM